MDAHKRLAGTVFIVDDDVVLFSVPSDVSGSYVDTAGVASGNGYEVPG
jgi:hypothetical protein